MRYLGVDYGSKRVGLALSDEVGTMGFPHSIIQNTTRLFEQIRALINKERVDMVIVGDSRNLSGEKNSIDDDARRLGSQIVEQIGIPVQYESEVFTSVEARRKPKNNQKRPSRSKKQNLKVDASAAAIILTSYLSRIKK